MGVLGIDLGTTWSCASYYSNGESKVAISPEGKKSIPSVVYIDSDTILVGESSNYIKNTNYSQDTRDKIKFNFKGTVGTNEDSVRYSSLVLEYIKRYSEEYFGCEFKEVVVTVPVYFSDQYRLATKRACLQAGFSTVIRIINEPTAAVLAYKTIKETTVLVFDCGGGTTDLSVTCIDECNNYQVLETVGDLNLGGNDVTDILVEYLYSNCPCKREIEKSQYRIDKVKSKLVNAAEMCKKELSYKKSVCMYIDNFYGDTDYKCDISQIKYKNLIQPFLVKVQNLVNQIKKEYSLVIFIGGSSRIPFFMEMFGNVPIKSDLDPETTVAQGAGYQGYLLTTDTELDDSPLLIDTVSLSVGIQLDGGIMGSIVSRGTSLPAQKSLEFRTSIDYESEYKVNFYQGECRFVKDNAYLGTLLLTDISCALKGQVLMTIEVSIDTDGLYTIIGYETKRKRETKKQLELSGCVLDTTFIESNLVHATENLYIDLIMSEKKILKIQLYDKFMELLEIFHDRKELLLGENKDEESFLMYKFNKIFTDTKGIIENYTNYTVQQLNDEIKKFNDMFYSTLCSISQYDLEEGTFCTDITE